MGSSATVAGGLPPLPPGAVLNSAPQQSSLPPLPPGAQLTGSPAAPPAQSNSLTDNPNGEGVYKMVDQQGAPVSVPYSKVSQAAQNGHFFADRQGLAQYARDHAADPLSEGQVDQYIDKLPWYNGVRMTRDLLAGAGGGALKTATAFDKAPRTQGEQQAQLAAETPAKGVAEGIGEAGENLGEFFTGEELLGLLGKGASATGEAMGMADKLKSATNLAQMLDKHPIIAKLLKIGASAVKQGTVGGAQTYVKTGGDTGAATEGGALTAATGAVLGGASEGAGNFVRNRAATLENVGGQEVPLSADLRNVKETPQQTAGKAAIKTGAQSALGRNLTEVNESRAVPENKPALPTRTGPYEFNLKGLRPTEGTEGEIAHPAAKVEGRHAFEQPQYTTSSAPKPTVPGNEGTMGADIASSTPREPQTDVAKGGGILKTQDPNIAKAHIANLNSIIDGPHFDDLAPEHQAQLLDARSDAARQMAEYHEQVIQNLPNRGRPNFEQIDIPQAVKKIGSWTDASQALEKTATDGYEHFNDITGGKFNAIRQANKDAWAAYKGASGTPAQDAAEKAIDETNRQMNDLMKSVHGAVSPKELSGFNDAYRNAQTMKYVANAVDGAFQGNSSSAARSWEYRGFDGNRMMANLSRLQQRVGRGPLERVVGKDNLDTLFQVAELNRTGAARAKFGAAIKPVVQNLIGLHVGPLAAGGFLGHMTGVGYEAGAVAGWATAAASRKVMDAVLTNPKVAQNLLFAIDSGAKPENYGPFIATLIQQQETENSKQKQATQGDEQ